MGFMRKIAKIQNFKEWKKYTWNQHPFVNIIFFLRFFKTWKPLNKNDMFFMQSYSTLPLVSTRNTKTLQIPRKFTRTQFVMIYKKFLQKINLVLPRAGVVPEQSCPIFKQCFGWDVECYQKNVIESTISLQIFSGPTSWGVTFFKQVLGKTNITQINISTFWFYYDIQDSLFGQVCSVQQLLGIYYFSGIRRLHYLCYFLHKLNSYAAFALIIHPDFDLRFFFTQKCFLNYYKFGQRMVIQLFYIVTWQMHQHTRAVYFRFFNNWALFMPSFFYCALLLWIFYCIYWAVL